MRLTLRTMLAYTDGILEPDDAEGIGKKIEESEYATGLLHRTRDVMRRLRLAAPSLTDRGPEFDPNTVAEYLDNTLHDDRVPDFEKVCLDSDVHLAEVASCHQILTLVLGEPAEIEPASRQRMYGLAHHDASQAETDQEAAEIDVVSGDGQSMQQPPPPKHRKRPVVPDYLRDPARKRRMLPVAAAVVVVACCVVTVLVAMGQFEPGTPLGRVLAQLGIGAEQVAEQTDAESPGRGADTSEPGPGEASPPGVEEISPPEAPLPQELADGQGPTVKSESEGPPVDPAVPGEPDATPVVPIDPGVEVDAAPEIAPMPPGNPPQSLDDSPLPPNDAVESAVETETPPIGTAPPPTEDPNAPEAPVPLQRMGRFMSNQEVLLRFDPDAATWHRVPAKGILYPEQRLIALPTYRPEIALSGGAGINLGLLGGTEIELLRNDEQGLARLRIRQGRTFIMPLIEGGAKLRLVVGGRSGVIAFVHAESVAAVEVVPVRLDGTNPEANPGLVTTYLYATKTGHVLWDEGEPDAVVRVDAGRCLILEGPPAAETSVVVSAAPSWSRVEAFGSWDAMASPVLEQALDAERPASLGLMELTEHRQREVRWLAARCLGRIGQFGPIVAALDDPQQRQLWPECFEELRQAVWRDGATAVAVRRAMQRQLVQDPEELDALARILWGYTEQDLRNGQAEKLIDYLVHDLLAFRVLSFSTLKDLTALRLNYAPEESELKRRQRAAVWKQRLESGEIWARLAEERERKAAGNRRPQSPRPGESL